jgi:ABC-type amino acid transport substrate-binding protein
VQELVAKDDCPIRGGHLACLAAAGVAAAQTPAVSKAGRERAKPARRSAARRLVPLGSLSVPGLQAWSPVLTGFDVEIERALERILGIEILLPETAWNAHLEALAAGTADIAAGATKERGAQRICVLLEAVSQRDRRADSPQGRGRTIRVLDDRRDAPVFAKQKFRLGVVAGFVYADSASTRSLQIHQQGLDRTHRE